MWLELAAITLAMAIGFGVLALEAEFWKISQWFGSAPPLTGRRTCTKW